VLSKLEISGNRLGSQTAAEARRAGRRPHSFLQTASGPNMLIEFEPQRPTVRGSSGSGTSGTISFRTSIPLSRITRIPPPS
jgi:hypothetical protein